MEIKGLMQAENYVRSIIVGRGGEILRVQPMNFVPEYRKYTHVALSARLKPEEEPKIYYVLYKREKFMSYGRQFNDHGFGESINLDAFKNIERSRYLDRILVVYPDGFIYYITPDQWRDYVRENETVRMQYGGEVTTSVNISILQRWDRDWTVQELEKWMQKPNLPARMRRCLMRLLC